jgi:hypothetical protein
MEAGKNSVIYMGLISGPNKADDTCGRTTVTGTMDRGFTAYSYTRSSKDSGKVTVVLCVNSDGSDKQVPIVIGKSPKP